MPRPKTGDKRASILRAATAVIAKDGIGASTARIAKTAAVAEGSLFRYFPDKDTLLNELYIDLKVDLRHTTVKEFPATASLRKRLEHIWDSYIRWGMESPEKRKAMAQLNVSERITEHSRQHGRIGMEDAVRALEELTARGRLNGMPMSFVADLLVAMVETTMTAMVTSPDAANHYRATGFDAFWSAAGTKQGSVT